MHNSLHQLQAISDLAVLDTIELVQYDHDLVSLQSRLMQSKKQVYRPGDKIVVLHLDTDYHYQNHPLGFVLHNLFVLWRELDIPYSVMVLVHNYHDITDCLDYFLTHDQDRPLLIHTPVNHISAANIGGTRCTSAGDIRYPALCLMGGARRAHRIKLFQYLKQQNLLDLVRTNFGISFFPGTKSKIDVSANVEQASAINAVYSHPHRSNQDFFNSSRLSPIMELASIPVEPYHDPVLEGTIDEFYGHFAVDIVTETMFHSPQVHLSEKTLRPLFLKSPFVMLAARGTLALLRSCGFRTFGDFWDEDYDNIADPHVRFLVCCRIIKDTCSKPLHELRLMRDEMQAILDHNHEVLVDYTQSKMLHLYKLIDPYDKCKTSHG